MNAYSQFVRFPRVNKRPLIKIGKRVEQAARTAGKFVYRHRKEIVEIAIMIGTAIVGRKGGGGRGRKR
jgi:hypothetical protein